VESEDYHSIDLQFFAEVFDRSSW